jgi:MFS family permease
MVVATILREPMMKELGVSDMGFATLGSVIFAGLIVGNLAGGFLADAFGRRGTLLGTGALVCLAGAASAAAIDIYTFAVLRFLTGIGIGSLIPEGRPLPIYTADIAAARAPGAPGAMSAV